MFNKQTTLDLDGPKLGFSTDPQNLTVNAGTAATFVAIGTATFPSNIPAKFATNTGIVTYRWYVDDVAVTDFPSEHIENNDDEVVQVDQSISLS